MLHIYNSDSLTGAETNTGLDRIHSGTYGQRTPSYASSFPCLQNARSDQVLSDDGDEAADLFSEPVRLSIPQIAVATTNLPFGFVNLTRIGDPLRHGGLAVAALPRLGHCGITLWSKHDLEQYIFSFPGRGWNCERHHKHRFMPSTSYPSRRDIHSHRESLPCIVCDQAILHISCSSILFHIRTSSDILSTVGAIGRPDLNHECVHLWVWAGHEYHSGSGFSSWGVLWVSRLAIRNCSASNLS